MMMEKEDFILQMRLKSCLQTILELEPELKNLEIGKTLVREFRVLRSLLSRLPSIGVCEDDVTKVEEATMVFLRELRSPLKNTLSSKRDRLQ